MKKIFLAFLLFIFTTLSYRYILDRAKRNLSSYKIISYTQEGKMHRLYVADTPQKWKQGLMEIKTLEKGDGMMFLFPDKQYRSFWNNNTYLDVDLYWLDGETVMGKSFLPSIEKSKNIITVSSPNEVDRVVELVKK